MEMDIGLIRKNVEKSLNTKLRLFDLISCLRAMEGAKNQKKIGTCHYLTELTNRPRIGLLIIASGVTLRCQYDLSPNFGRVS